MASVIATREQERKALAQIRKIVEQLGKDSYIATAFEGCFEIAESNIENDFACSMKQRADENYRLAEEAQVRAENLRNESNRLGKTIDVLKKENSALQLAKRRGLSSDDLSDIKQLIDDRISLLETEADEASKTIIECAENPDSNEFKNAVKEHRSAKSAVEHFTKLCERVRICGKE